ncbi:MAG: hypothetical protein AAF208_14490 [Cyanobacteria bacterium P01_A01_bin.45]
MKYKRWKQVCFYVFFVYCGGSFYSTQTVSAQTNELTRFRLRESLVSDLPSFRIKELVAQNCKKCQQSFLDLQKINPIQENTIGPPIKLLKEDNLLSTGSSNTLDRKLIAQLSFPLGREETDKSNFISVNDIVSQNETTSESESQNNENTNLPQTVPPPVEGQTTEIKNPSTEDIEEQLETPEIDRIEQIEKLIKILQGNIEKSIDPNNDPELGRIVVREKPTELKPNLLRTIDPELGFLKLREKPIEQLPLPQPREDDFKPVGSLSVHAGYFNTSNIFSSEKNPEADGLIYSGLSLSSVPIKIAPKTYLRGSVSGNLFRYLNNAEFNYNQFKVNLNLYQRLSKKMYAELGWKHQELFYARSSDRFNFSSGEKFLDENSLHLSFGRRDPLTRRLMLDSFYELRVNLTNPSIKRNRIVNFLSVSLNYYFKRSLRLGFGYQYNYSDFIERIREDQYHRLLANLNYGVSKDSNLSLQSGVTLGDSTQNNIDFDNWFFSINYSLDLGKF